MKLLSKIPHVGEVIHTEKDDGVFTGREPHTSNRNQMKLFTAIAAFALAGTSLQLASPVKANSFRYCSPGTRCQEYTACYINDVRQPCAYGSGGARLGSIIFDHGEFDIEWVSKDFAHVTYGTKKEFKVKATITRGNGPYTTYQLSDGVTVKIPNAAGRFNPVGGPLPTHR